MKPKLHGILISAAAMFLAACSSERQGQGEYDGLVHTSFEESAKVIANPERGFYSPADFTSASNSSLKPASIKANRIQNKTLYYTGYYLTDFMTSDISEDYLNLMRANFEALREGGAKCVLRFAYKKDMSEAGKPWDAEPQWVLRHIGQLKPLFREYSDVIFVLQAGLVGVWGEWYYTSNFVFNPSTVEDHSLRKQVVDALLDAMPSDRQVSLRTPMFKRMMYTEGYADTLTCETAYSGSDLSRLGGHNDCFGADGSDMGTFAGGESREFWKKESRYTIMGGETCQLSSFCACDNSLKDMEDYHWTYLNSNYNGSVLSGWRTGGCYEEVERRLGYRLWLSDVYSEMTPAAGKNFRVVMKLNNSGFAAPMNPRAAELVLVDGNGVKTVYELSDADPRYWFAGNVITLDETIAIPAEASGNCSLYLNLPDPEEELHDNPLFSIRLANDGIYEEATGYNRLIDFSL